MSDGNYSFTLEIVYLVFIVIYSVMYSVLCNMIRVLHLYIDLIKNVIKDQTASFKAIIAQANIQLTHVRFVFIQ